MTDGTDSAETLRLAYADPPYLGYAGFYDHPETERWNTLEAHAELFQRLQGFDGWAVSMTSGNLRDLLPLAPEDARIAAWVKPFCSFKLHVNPAYTWEPVLFKSARKRDRDELTVRDYLSCGITLRRGLVGAKPEAFCRWVLQLMGYRPGDAVEDLFPGTGVMGRVLAQQSLDLISARENLQ